MQELPISLPNASSERQETLLFWNVEAGGAEGSPRGMGARAAPLPPLQELLCSLRQRLVFHSRESIRAFGSLPGVRCTVRMMGAGEEPKERIRELFKIKKQREQPLGKRLR